MQPIPAQKWSLYLSRISQRYAGCTITLRQRHPDDDEPQVVLWRTPLRQLLIREAGAEVELIVVAGQEEPFQISIGPVRELSIQLAPDQSLEALRARLADGTVATLLVQGKER